MKAKTLTILFLVYPFFGLHAAESNIETAEPDSSTIPAVEIIPEGIEGAAPETLTETLIETIEETANGSSDENFVPSIRITEDLPVAFPIDI